jgi:hypothetical protein
MQKLATYLYERRIKIDPQPQWEHDPILLTGSNVRWKAHYWVITYDQNGIQREAKDCISIAPDHRYFPIVEESTWYWLLDPMKLPQIKQGDIK